MIHVDWKEVQLGISKTMKDNVPFFDVMYALRPEESIKATLTLDLHTLFITLMHKYGATQTMNMIVCMNYTDSGERYIAKLWYDNCLTRKELTSIAYEEVNYFSEVYIVNIDPNSQDFINEIVLHGCRFS